MFQFFIKSFKSYWILTILLLTPCLYAQASNKIVAVINDQVVTQNQLNHVIHIIKQQSQAMGRPIDPSQLKKEALKQLIDNKLLLQVAKQNGISATDAEVNQHIKQVASQNHLPLEAFKKALQKEGSNFKAYSDFVKEQMTLSKLRSQVLGAKVKVTASDIEAELAHVKTLTLNAPVNIVDVLITPVSEQDLPTAKKTATVLQKTLMQGKTLEDGMKSIDHIKVKITPQDLGWKALTELPELFANAVKNLPMGQVTQPIEAPNGIHLLIMKNRKGGALSRQDAERIALHKKMQAEVEKWLIQLKKQAYIEIKP